MNLSLQSLMHIDEFKDYVLISYMSDINESSPYQSNVAQTFANLIEKVLEARKIAQCHVSPQDF